MDVEIEAMSKIAEALSELDEAGAERVLRWAVGRYAAKSGVSKDIDQRAKERSYVLGIADFTDLSRLFDAADPSSESEKVLVASYWYQEVQGYPEVDALTVNKALKDLGHGIGNITREFGKLQSEKPALMLQTQKKGRTQQARKKYKVTAAGARRVGQMVSKMGE
jgi:hypothetical protein